MTQDQKVRIALAVRELYQALGAPGLHAETSVSVEYLHMIAERLRGRGVLDENNEATPAVLPPGSPLFPKMYDPDPGRVR